MSRERGERQVHLVPLHLRRVKVERRLTLSVS